MKVKVRYPLKKEDSNRDGQDEQDKNYRCANLKSQISNLKLDCIYPVYPVHPC
jgi:hypothetical protein